MAEDYQRNRLYEYNLVSPRPLLAYSAFSPRADPTPVCCEMTELEPRAGGGERWQEARRRTHRRGGVALRQGDRNAHGLAHQQGATAGARGQAGEIESEVSGLPRIARRMIEWMLFEFVG